MRGHHFVPFQDDHDLEAETRHQLCARINDLQREVSRLEDHVDFLEGELHRSRNTTGRRPWWRIW